MRRRAVAMPRAEDQARERRRRERRRRCRASGAARQPFLAQPIQLGLRKRRPQHDVRQERQRRRRAWTTGVCRRTVDDVERAAGAERRAEEIDGVGQLERVARPGAFVEHRRREIREAELAGRIGGGARLDDERDVDDRALRASRRSRPAARSTSARFWIGGSFSAGAGPVAGGLDRSGACCAGDGATRPRARPPSEAMQRSHHAHLPSPAGTTDSSSRRSAGSQRRTAAWTSFGLERAIARRDPR